MLKLTKSFSQEKFIFVTVCLFDSYGFNKFG